MKGPLLLLVVATGTALTALGGESGSEETVWGGDHSSRAEIPVTPPLDWPPPTSARAVNEMRGPASKSSSSSGPVGARSAVEPSGAGAGVDVEHGDESDPEAANRLIGSYCVRCHNGVRLLGNMSLEEFDAATVADRAELGEKMVRKLRAGMMPPPRQRRPGGDSLAWLAAVLEGELDALAAADPNPGHRTFQRLNRSEYERAVFDMLGLRVDASAFLPPETMSGGFDNVADAQRISATLLEGYLTAAAAVARMAVGDPNATPSETTYRVPRYAEQRTRVEGAPFGTRGGISLVHNFPADGYYRFRLGLQHESTGNFFGQTSPFDEKAELSVDGERRALVHLDRWIHVQDPDGPNVRTEPIFITAGPHRVTAAFLETMQGPVEDLVSPHAWSLADKKIGYSYGITSVAHLRDFAITGPFEADGVSDFAVREKILTCADDATPGSDACARHIVEGLASRGFRRPVGEADVEPLLVLYREGRARGGFEVGVRTALQAVLASPEFIFRFEEPTLAEGPFPLAPIRLATRLAFFLWATGPDEELLQAAGEGELESSEGLAAQVERMLADPRSEALATRFASQWLRLQDLDKVHPDALRFPDFHQQLADAMKRETELFFAHLVREDLPLFEVLTADYTFLNERLARHYGIPGVAGDHFRKVAYPDDGRMGVLSHGSILTSTSHANRTSPVLRGKWVMEVLLGTPPPPPPADVPDLEATEAVREGRNLTVRERLEMHRASPQCTSCHRFIDPIGLALEGFDVTGAVRIKDEGAPIDLEGELYDGTPLTSPKDLTEALLKRRSSLARTFIENLMAYAIGRRIEYFDMPAVREIERTAAVEDYRLAAFIQAVVASDAFRMGRIASETDGGFQCIS